MKEKANRIKHDMSRIATTLKLLADEIDTLFVDVECNITEEGEYGDSD